MQCVSRRAARFGLFSGSLVIASCISHDLAPPELCNGRLAGDLVITEIMADPSGADTGKEYVEIFNRTAVDVDLEGVTLFKSAADGSGRKAVRLKNAIVQAGSYFVLGDARGNVLPVYLDYAYGAALGSLPSDAGRVGVSCGAELIDEVAYRDVRKGRARELDGAFAPGDDTSRRSRA
jgi:hypothetical protein